MLVVVHAPGLRFLGRQRTTVHVPAVGDSEPVMFELRPDTPGPRSVSVTAWLGGVTLVSCSWRSRWNETARRARIAMCSLK